MARFPSLEWGQEAVRLAALDPEAGAAGSGWQGDLAVVFLPEAPHLPRGFAAHFKPRGPLALEVRVLDSLDQVDSLGAAYVVKAAYSVWKELLKGELDPVEAVLRRKVTFTGDLQPIVQRAGQKGWIERVLTRVPTEFIDE